MSTTFNPEIAALRDKVEEHSKELAEMRGNLHQLDKIIGATVRQSIWQLIAVIVTLLVAIAGGLAYQTSAIDKRIEQMEKSSNTRFEMIEKRIEQSEEEHHRPFRGSREEYDRTVRGPKAGSPGSAKIIWEGSKAQPRSYASSLCERAKRVPVFSATMMR